PERINYAILSHTWESGEVIYGDLENGTTFGPQARSKAGMSKISNFCDTAQRKDLEFGWVDTCCIDKSSSAELTESINSMFKWYKSAAVCIVYLHDLAPATGRATSVVVSDLRRCKWFTRGWTLQELIAPSNVEFYDAEWNFRGTKDDLAPQLSQITRIDVEVLRNSDLMYNVPVARRMSWAADRVTTRLEDRAYSMLGIFDVNLSMIYGEGDKAFMRLQEAIAKENNDLSLFAWTSEPYGESPEFRGIFAQDPSEFRRCDKLIVQDDPVIPKSPFSITNLGLEITACLASSKEHEDYLLNLHCSYGVVTIENQQNGVAAIRLVKTTKGYVRHSMNQPLMIDQALLSFRDPVSVYIPKTLTLAECTAARLRLTNAMYVSIGGQAGHRAKITAWSPEHLWDSSAGLFLTGSHPHFTAVLELDFNTRADDPGNLPKVAVVIGLR
ncbi:HET-domain-containing protein, partial [Thozetella sp. PMI_491]